MRLGIRAKLFLMFFAVILTVSGSIGSYFYWNARSALMDSLQQRLKSSAALVVRSVDAQALDKIRQPADVHLAEYQKTLARLRSWVASNEDLAFIYVMQRNTAGEVSFLVDSDASPEQAQPGDLYEPAPPQMLAGFDKPSVDDSILEDAWGSFLTGYAPVPGREGRYLLGIDMRADEVEAKFQRLHLSGAVSLALSLCLAWLFSAWVSRQFLRPVQTVISQCEHMAAGQAGLRIDLRTGDELDTLIGAFNRLSSALRDEAESTDAARLRLSVQEAAMEAQIQRRVSDLSSLNAELLAESKALRLANEALSAELRRDELTGLANRKAAMAMLDDLRTQAQRGGRSFSLLLILMEPDGERRQIPPGALDETLRRFAFRAQGYLREGDIMARFEAFQFLVIMPGASLAQAEALAMELADKLGVRETVAHAGEELGLSRYFGAAHYQLGESILACLERVWLSLPRR
ncbi:MAG: diguanylate cyclase [Gammaproteobacteria bacterium]|nr:diguanylate cyclase [Gammaproteobacteria bacterium]